VIKEGKELNDVVCTAYRMGCDQTREVYQKRIEKLEAALQEIVDIHPFKDPEGDASVKALVDLVFHINLIARRALNTSAERVNETGES
jgi:hypothetical protein